jgi:hypothetical protein
MEIDFARWGKRSVSRFMFARLLFKLAGLLSRLAYSIMPEIIPRDNETWMRLIISGGIFGMDKMKTTEKETIPKNMEKLRLDRGMLLSSEVQWQETREMYRALYARGCIEREDMEEVIRDSARFILYFRQTEGDRILEYTDEKGERGSRRIPASRHNIKCLNPDCTGWL